MTPLRSLLRTTISQLIPQIDEDEIEHVEERVSAGHFTLILIVAPRAKTPLPGSFLPEKPLTHMERKILSVCSPEPKTGKRIAREMAHKYDGYLRELLSGLADKRVLERTEDGYRTARISTVKTDSI